MSLLHNLLLFTLCFGSCAAASEGSGAEPAPSETPESNTSEIAESDASKVIDARDYFRLAGIDDSQFSRLTDGTPWSGTGDELLWKILYRIKDFSAETVDAWGRKPFDAAEARSHPDRFRGRFFGLRGRVRRIDVETPPEEVVQRYGLRRYYRCYFESESLPGPALVFARRVPLGLPIATHLDARSAAVGCFLKWADDGEGNSTPVFAARRLAWFPPTPLGDLGFDVGLLDTLKDKKTLLASERECFYQLLDAVGRAKPGSLLKKATSTLEKSGRERFSVVPLFTDPAAQRGKLFAFTGTVRRVVRVVVEDPDIIRRFGIREYYQMALFTEDSQGNPITFCVRSVPPDMPLGGGDNYAQTVTVAGFFLKNWAFHSEFATKSAKASGDAPVAARQFAPLLIGKQPFVLQRPERPGSAWGLAAGLIFLAFLSGIWIVLRRLARADRRRDRRRIADMAGDMEETEAGESAITSEEPEGKS